MRPHVLGIDDAPFQKDQDEHVPIVGVMMEGATLVEEIALGGFPVDGSDATGYLSTWVSGQRWHPALQAVVLGGITIAGLGMVDLPRLADELAVPVVAVTRHDTETEDLERALSAAGLSARLPILQRAPASYQLRNGLFAASAGIEPADAERIIRATLHKARLPEPLRLAHLFGAALINGHSRGRV